MTQSLLPVGAFVWCRLPISENPCNPGPKDHLHLVYVEDSTDDGSVLTIYTTSAIWQPKARSPIGVLVVTSELASAMGQMPFVLDATRIALLPVTTEWFPGLAEPGHGIVLIADESFQKKETSTAHAALSRASSLEYFAPKAPSSQPGLTPPG